MDPGKVFVGGISWETSEGRLREYFETFGEVVEAVIMKDRTTGRARGFGFVVFEDSSVAERVVKEKHIIDGRTVEAKKAVPRDEHYTNKNNVNILPVSARTRKIFVGGLASSVSESDFKKYFDQFGTITDVVVMYDHNTQRPRGFGFITYDSEEAVDRVLHKMFHELNGKMVEVKRAVPKELSPGPIRSPLTGYNNSGLNRVNSILNGYTLGQGLSSLGGYASRMERYSPTPVGRSGYSLFNQPNFGERGNLGANIGYGRTQSPFSSGISSCYDTPIQSGSVLNSTSWNLWDRENDIVGLGSLGAIWGSSSISSHAGKNGPFENDIISYNNGGNSFVSGRRFAQKENVYSRDLGNLYGPGKSLFFDDPTQYSSSPLRDVSSSFGYGPDSISPDAISNNSLDGLGGYGVTNISTREIAA
ncbi:unnamed protein product [Cuscuta campestris]|uniref:RRM domain-containing protein n=1 Tax=Cuscuta campestris TaxID=132261 RepID=A0A484K749_9ASTE|nr:unnamed protein product [Cuscuta campestris]